MTDLERYAELWKGHNGYEEFDLEENEEQEFQSLKAKLEESLEFKKRFDENKLYESERFNLCNPKQSEYCLFEAQVDDLQQKLEKIQSWFNNHGCRLPVEREGELKAILGDKS